MSFVLEGESLPASLVKWKTRLEMGGREGLVS